MLNIVAPNIFKGDAVGDFCIDVAEALKAQGVSSRVYAKNYSAPDIFQYDVLLSDSKTSKKDLLYFHSTHDVNLERLLLKKFRNRIIYYHGITKPQFFNEDPVAYDACVNGIKQIKFFENFDYFFANSNFNCQNLINLGEFENVTVVPYPPIQRNARPESSSESRPVLKTDILKVLSIGRLTPHKKIDDAIEYAAQLSKHFDEVEFNIIGSETDHLTAEAIRLMIAKFNNNIPNLSIVFHGFVEQRLLSQYVSESDVYITMSEDEGFCIPLYEMVEQNKICVAYWNNAYSDYLEKSELHLEAKTPEAIFRSINFLKHILSSEQEYVSYLQAQKKHLSECSKNIVKSDFVNNLIMILR